MSAERLYAPVDGIYCEHCVETITRALASLDGVTRVSVRQNTACIEGEHLPSPAAIAAAIRGAGYETDEARIGRRPIGARYHEILIIAAGLLALAALLRRVFGRNVFNMIPTVDSSLSYGMLFVTGLMTSVHCISMCGAIGLAASGETNAVRSLRRPLLYNAGRVISYTAIGGIVGLAGGVLHVSPAAQGAIILAASVLMLLMALQLLGLVRLRLPRLLTLKTGVGRAGPFVIGLLNGLMPCGPLQAMQLYALSTGSTLSGALAMMLFALGTVPLMLASGAVIDLSRGRVRTLAARVMPVMMLLLAISMMNRGLLALGVDVIPDRGGDYLSATLEDGVQTASFTLAYDAYADLLLQKGVPARIVIHADESMLTGCNNEVVCPELAFDVPLRPGDNVIDFTPQEEGEFVYTCWMNMIKNRIRVVDDPDRFERN